ncbi:hypothetical protein WR25_21023 [Diploscapter pachys]|uniref:Uncharacterized protein n=1 Tax=Diploscapter pachys TaxID=2018661 RepID=A0A2A2KFX7_9BILA|nr:hypothetical protein WR25_21023 [Diploscapter pachys]
MPVTLLTALTLAQSAPLPATLPERFYNRPGASVTTRDADLVRCLAIATQPMADIGPAVVKDRRLTPPVGATQDGPPIPADDPIETCMSNRGWRLYALTRREQTAWARLSAPARARLADTLTGATQPRWGRLVRPASRLRLNGGSLKH